VKKHEDRFMDDLFDAIDPCCCDLCWGTGEGIYLGWSYGYEDCEACDGTGFKEEVTQMANKRHIGFDDPEGCASYWRSRGWFDDDDVCKLLNECEDAVLGICCPLDKARPRCRIGWRNDRCVREEGHNGRCIGDGEVTET